MVPKPALHSPQRTSYEPAALLARLNGRVSTLTPATTFVVVSFAASAMKLGVPAGAISAPSETLRVFGLKTVYVSTIVLPA
jgi:hypothetical protein